MDAHQYGIGLSILGQQIHHQLLRKDPIPSFTLVELGDRLAVSRSYVLIKQFPTGMGLPAVGRLTASQTSLQNRSRSEACATRHGRIDNFNSGVLLFVNFEKRIECGSLAAGSPPGKDF